MEPAGTESRYEEPLDRVATAVPTNLTSGMRFFVFLPVVIILTIGASPCSVFGGAYFLEQAVFAPLVFFVLRCGAIGFDRAVR
jgi:hypothetical protein